MRIFRRQTPNSSTSAASESAAADQVLGIEIRENFGLPDGGLTETLEARKLVVDAIRRHLAVLTNASAPERARRISVDALLTALSGGYELETRVEIATALLETVDDSMRSLLAEHLRDIEDEARDFDRQELAATAGRLLERLGSPEE